MGRHYIPSYRLHRPSGKAVVTLNGKDYYLGPYGSATSRQEYDKLIAEWMSNGRCLPDSDGEGPTVTELAIAFLEWADQYYTLPGGRTPREPGNYRSAFKPLRRLYGKTSAKGFSPRCLRALQDEYIRLGWCRDSINKQCRRIKATFKWAASRELVPGSVWQDLDSVSGLRKGRSQACESEPVTPVMEATVAATLPFMTPTLRAMVQLQQLTGMRPGEVCIMRTCDVDTTNYAKGSIWMYTPQFHKTQHHGRTREIPIGPQAQKVLAPFLKTDLQAYIFSPAQSDAERRAALHAARTTPAGCGNVPGSHRQRRPRRIPGDSYANTSYGKAIAYACDQAWPVPDELKRANGETTPRWRKRLGNRWKEVLAWRREHRWAPNQLRHSFATMVRKKAGLEAAQVLLGHAKADITQIYAEADRERGMQLAAHIG